MNIVVQVGEAYLLKEVRIVELVQLNDRLKIPMVSKGINGKRVKQGL